MKAVVMNGIGDIGVLEHVERPTPSPKAGEVLVEVAAAGVNFMDIGVRQGMAWNEMPGIRKSSAWKARAGWWRWARA